MSTTSSTEIDLRRYLDGIGGFIAGSANVVMQLSWPEVGHGVVESKVERGRLFDHPFKRGRTTLTYIAVALIGTDADRAAYRKAVNTAHVQVRSTPESPVAYNAFDPELQLWVAACLYYGMRDVITALHGPMDEATEDEIYRQGARFGTTLQVPQEMWPEDREAFAAYWEKSLARVDIDDTVRAYLLHILDSRMLPWFVRHPGWRAIRFFNIGFLPPEFREQLGLAWSPSQERRFRRWTRLIGRVYAALPLALRNAPFNLYLRDMRRRVRRGQRLV
jgi:uncharacterized protein (DUF2236 family)